MRHTAVAPALLFLALPAAAYPQVLRAPGVTRTFTAIPVGASPTLLAATPSTTPTSTSIGLRWGCPDGASGFDVYATQGGGAQSKLTPAPIPAQCVLDIQRAPVARGPLSSGSMSTSTGPTYSLGYTHAGMNPGSSWSSVVVALYPNGAQGTSTPVSVQADLLPAPGGLAAVPLATRTAQLTWASIPQARFYEVYRKRAGEPAFTMVATPQRNETSWTDSNLRYPEYGSTSSSGRAWATPGTPSSPSSH